MCGGKSSPEEAVLHVAGAGDCGAVQLEAGSPGLGFPLLLPLRNTVFWGAEKLPCLIVEVKAIAFGPFQGLFVKH